MIRLLIVDDSALMRRLLSDIFSREADFEVRTAANGMEALAAMPAFNPDVITLDVHMPGLDGLACLKRIMIERPRPVVMVSSLTAAGAEATFEALRLGAVDFVAKPDRAMSLSIDALAPLLVDKVRAAAKARLRASLHLKERVRHRIGGGAAPAPIRQPARTKSAATGPRLVLIGTSTGGPPALEAVLGALPADFPWPVVVAQHMPASFTGPLARRLDRLCPLSVAEVTQPTPLAPGHVHIGRGDADLIISRRPAGLVVMPAPAKRDYPWHPSTDRLVRSALEATTPAQLIGVLMTGMGYDGAAAMAELRELGGQTIAESEESAVVWGMPGELVKLGGADWIEPVSRIASRLRSLSP